MTCRKSRGAATLVMQEKAEAPAAFILFRGEYDKRRDPVTAATPGALPPFPKDLPHNRLGRQMISKLKVYAGPEHPHSAQRPQTILFEHARAKSA